MKKLLVVTGLVLSSMMSYGQDKPKDDYKITLGVTSGVYHSTNFGGWISIGKIGVEYTKGSGKKELRSTPIDFTNIGVNYYFKKIFVGIGRVQVGGGLNISSSPGTFQVDDQIWRGKARFVGRPMDIDPQNCIVP